MAIRDLTGCRFGMLVALEATDERKDECVVWRCRCDCGKEIFVSSNKLRQQRITSCGCLKKEIQSNLCKSVQIIDHTAVEWLENRKHRRDSTSGFRGVYRTRNNRYYAAIGFKQRSYYLGRYDTLEEAIAVRLDAADHPFVFDVQMVDGALQVTTSEPEVLAKHESSLDER